MEPRERIKQGIGVVGVKCAVCQSAVIVVNASAVQQDLAQYGAAYYHCRACSARDDLEERLAANGNGDGLELLVC